MLPSPSPSLTTDAGRRESDETARKYVRVAHAFQSQLGWTRSSPPTIEGTALELLADKSVPQAARDEAVSRAEAGEHITKAEAESMVQKAVSEKVREAIEQTKRNHEAATQTAIEELSSSNRLLRKPCGDIC
jgi:nucleoid-associated protein YgaU